MTQEFTCNILADLADLAYQNMQCSRKVSRPFSLLFNIIHLFLINFTISFYYLEKNTAFHSL